MPNQAGYTCLIEDSLSPSATSPSFPQGTENPQGTEPPRSADVSQGGSPAILVVLAVLLGAGLLAFALRFIKRR